MKAASFSSAVRPRTEGLCESQGEQDTRLRSSIAPALELGDRELIALVGAGGKSTLLGRLTTELVSGGSRVLASTTTAVWEDQLTCLGPLFLMPGPTDSLARAMIRGAFRSSQIVAVAKERSEDGKLRGLSAPEMSSLWGEGLSDFMIVEADGSRGMPLKAAFGVHEPQIPAATTLVILMVGLDALSAPLAAPTAHRARELAAMLGVPEGVTVTPDLLAGWARIQVAHLRRICRARIILFLNKAEVVGYRTAGLAALRLLDASTPSWTERDGVGPPTTCERADTVVFGSLHNGLFHVL